jgi:hypothetical protein
VSDQVIAKHNANALIQDAEASLPLPDARLTSAILGEIQEFKQAHGGLWVGGKAILTPSTLEFSPNAVNRAVNKGTLDIRIPLTEITAVATESGLITKIIAIQVPGATFKVRCYGAEKFAGQIRTAMTAAGASPAVS